MLLSPKCTTIVRGKACFANGLDCVVMVTIHFLAERVDGASVQAATCRGLGSRSKRSATVNIDRRCPRTSTLVRLGDVTIRTMARFIQGTCGLANIDNDDRIRAEDVTYDNSDGLYPPGTDTVQLALEATGGGASVAEMTPTVAGTAYGLQDTGTVSNLLGRNSFNNYAAAPIQLSGVTAVGNNLYQASTPASNSFSNSIFLGRAHQFTGATTITNSLIAASIVGISSVSKIQDASMVVPRAASLTFGYTGEINGPAFFSSGNIACTQDPLYSTVVSSGGTVNPGANNLVLSSAPVTNSIIMNGQGNTLITAAPSAFTYVHPAFSNCTTILGGSSAVSATSNLQLCTNHKTLRMPNVLTVSGALLAANLTPMYFDVSTGLISPTVSSRASRIWRGTGTTDGAGQVIFTPGGGLAPNTAGYAVNLTVANNSTTIAYTAQVETLTATQIFARVFRSDTVVLGGPSMTLAGAGIVLHATMAW